MSNEIQTVNEAEITTPAAHTGNFIDSFRESYKVAQVLCKSSIIPQNYQGRADDTAIAIDMANRIGVSPLMVMQNLYVVKGKPSWSGQSCISFIKNKYGNISINYTGEKNADSRGCYVSVVDKDGKIINGTEITMSMAKSEGWTSNKKWQTMPEQMLAYRAAAFFARIYCPEVLMGCQVEGEAEDITPDKRIVEDVL